MQDNGLSLVPAAIGGANDQSDSALAMARRVLQGVGGGLCVALAAVMPWAEFSSAGIAIGSYAIPRPFLALIGLTVLASTLMLARSVLACLRRLPSHIRFGAIAIAAFTLCSLAGFEYGWFRTGSIFFYEYRTAARLIGYTLGIALLTCSVPEEVGQRIAAGVSSLTISRRVIGALAIFAGACGALIGIFLLDGMPHMIDGTSYLLQGRILWSGQLAIQPPMYPALFADELMHFRITDAGYFSKYPIGWPALLGLFDAASVPWLANAVLAGLLVLLTYAVVAESGNRRLAGLTAAIVAMCPWLWLNASTMMAHLASAVWLWLFFWLFLRTLKRQSRGYALLAGLVLGAAILTRPSDAAFFAFPCIAASLAWTVRQRELWLTRLPLIAVGALPGLAAYLWVSKYLAGSGLASTYGNGHAAMLFTQMPQSPWHMLIWMQESWVGLSTQWFAGAMPLALLVVVGLIFGRSQFNGQRMALACSASLMLCYTVFVFGGRGWIGPRWYVPLIPAMALLIAAGLLATARTGRVCSSGGVLAAGYLRMLTVGAAVTLCVAMPAKLYELHAQPPHGIDGQVVQQVELAGLTQAVVALPVDGLDPETRMPNYKRGIAGMWAMQVPFEQSPVIYIAAIEGWQAMAQEAWPTRRLYLMNGQAGDMTITPVTLTKATP